MSATTAIEWTDRTWNPVTGCRKVSPGCKHCYAEGVAHRFWHHQYVHTVERGFIPVKAYAADALTGTLRKFTDVMTHEDRLLEPLSWKKPARVFVNSMSDLFHEDVPDAFIDQVFAVMALAPQHTFQVLTKRPERMRAYLTAPDVRQRVSVIAAHICGDPAPDMVVRFWPLLRVWLGVSVEDQQRADERIPLLLQTPASGLFISAEPLLGPVVFGPVTDGAYRRLWPFYYSGKFDETAAASAPPCPERRADLFPRIDWVIVGGESGHGARPCDVSWVRSIVRQCQAAAVPVFVKQLGANPIWRLGNGQQANSGAVPAESRRCAGMVNAKGGEPSEWPEDLRVREFPR